MAQGTKFSSCLCNCSTLTLNVPPDVYPLVASQLKELGIKVPKIKKPKLSNGKQEKSILEASTKIFGVPLADLEWTYESESPIPKFLAQAIIYLREFTKVEIGLFRKAGSVSRQRQLRIKLESGKGFESSEPNDVASLLKQWLRELPEPVIPSNLHETFVKSISLSCESDCVTAALLTCLLLPLEHLYTLKHLLKFLSTIAANSDVNKMGFYNLAVVMVPNVFRTAHERPDKSGNGTVKLYTKLLELLIVHWEDVGEIPKRPDAAGNSNSESKFHNFSIEILDCSPAVAQKKLKSGGVTDVVNSIKKLVGGNAATGTSTVEQSFRSSTKPKTPCRSANKRKASAELQLMTDIKKLPTTETRSSNSTVNPMHKNQFLPILTPSSHQRRRSFGILGRRRTKPKNMSTKETSFISQKVPESTSNSVKNSSENQQMKHENCHLAVPQEITVVDVHHAATLSDESGKLSETDAVQQPVQQNMPSPLRSTSPKCSLNSNSSSPKSPSLKPMASKHQLKPKAPENKANSILSPSTVKKLDVIYKLQNDGQAFRRAGSGRRSSKRKPSRNPEQPFRRHASQNKSFRSSGRKPVCAPKILSQSTLAPSQDAANVQAVNPSTSQETSDDVFATPDLNTSECLIKRGGGYKSSLKRGRPNTVKTGLKTKSSPKKCRVPILSLDEPSPVETSISQESDKPLHGEETTSNKENIKLDSEFMNVLPKRLFDSLLCDGSPEKTTPMEMHVMGDSPDGVKNISGVEIVLNKRIPRKCGQESQQVHKNASIRAVSTRLSAPKSCVSADTVTPSVDEARKSAPAKICCETSTESSQRNTHVEQNILSAEEKEEWFDANYLLSCNMSSKEPCKRESIIQILTNNSGMVHAQVQRFDGIGTSVQPEIAVSITTTPIVPRPMQSFITPRSRSDSVSSVSKLSVKSARYRKSPLPLAPKFSVTDIKSPSPLKEVTNLSTSQLSVDSVKDSPVTVSKRKLPAVDSSGKIRVRQTGMKTAKAQRSESSPARPAYRQSANVTTASKHTQVDKPKLHSHSFTMKDIHACDDPVVLKKKYDERNWQDE